MESLGDWRRADCDDDDHKAPTPAPTPYHDDECHGEIHYEEKDGYEYPICGPDNEFRLHKKLRCPDDACCSQYG